jgi:hypothetical protein
MSKYRIIKYSRTLDTYYVVERKSFFGFWFEPKESHNDCAYHHATKQDAKDYLIKLQIREEKRTKKIIM